MAKSFLKQERVEQIILRNSTLLHDQREQGKESVFSSGEKIYEVELDKIVPNPYQPRMEINEDELEELKNSILQRGLLQPILLSKNDDGTFTIIAGHRRYAACKSLGIESIRSIITKASDEQLKVNALVENLQRKDLKPLEVALAYKTIIESLNKDKTKEEFTYKNLAELVGKSQSHVTMMLNILKLSPEVQQYIREKNYKNIVVLNELNKLEPSRQLPVLIEIADYSRDEAIAYIRKLSKTKIEKSTIGYDFKEKKGVYSLKLNISRLNQDDKLVVIEKLKELIKILEM